MPDSLLVQNIASQPESLADVLAYQRGGGSAPLEDAAALLRSANRVVITGMGASLFASIPLEYALCSQGIDATVVEAGELLHYRRASLRDAVVVVVSRSGESIEIARLMAALKGRTATLGISNDPNSTLARSATVSILIGSRDDEYVALQTYTGTLLTLHLLAAAVAQMTTTASTAVEGLLPRFSQLVKRCMDGIELWDDFLDIDSPIHLLARGPSCASAYEGALLFNEVSKTTAVGMAAGSFRHGPVEVVDAKFLGLIFASEGNSRELNLALAADMARFGARIKVIGPRAHAPSPNFECFDMDAVDAMLAPLFEIVPVQVAALRMAQRKGIRPGSFRYAPRVAVDEASFVPNKEA